ncbi:phage portal protein [Chondrinema litorale]|uniref:phage portal protein n=1 Tax=Chondrinema litorale TaxID=2994555 RepID=UPI002542A4C4|nr:phage portal protein [Chondrinema litorale]UZS00259.1 phage portal protein [Chondrinema litorale]
MSKPAFFQDLFHKLFYNPGYRAGSFDAELRSDLKHPQQWLVEAMRNQSGAGVSVNFNNATAIPTANRCVGLLASIPAKLPVRLCSKTDNGKEVKEGDLRDKMLHYSPNDFLTPSTCLEILETTRVLRGNALAGIIRNSSGVAYSLEVLPREHTEIKVSKGKVFYHQKQNFLGEKVDKVWKHEDVINVTNFSSNGIVGLSNIAHHRATLGLSIAQQTSAEKFFKNGAVTEGYLTSPTGYHFKDDEQLENFKKGWKKQTSGLDNHHSTPLLQYGFEYKPITMPFKDAQFLESREFSGVDICRIFSVPPTKAFFLKDAHYNNVSQLNTEFYIDTVLLTLTKYEHEFNKKFLFDSEQGKSFFKFNVKALLRGDVAAQSDYYMKMVQNGIYNRNEIRSLEDDNNIDGGEIYTVQMQMTELKNTANNTSSKQAEEISKKLEKDFITIDVLQELINLNKNKQLNGHKH